MGAMIGSSPLSSPASHLGQQHGQQHDEEHLRVHLLVTLMLLKKSLVRLHVLDSPHLVFSAGKAGRKRDGAMREEKM